MLRDFKKGLGKLSKNWAFQHLGILEYSGAEDVIGEKAAVSQIKDHCHFHSFV